jgi:hypothetical protein
MTTEPPDVPVDPPLQKWTVPRTKSHTWPAWAGGKDDPERLGKCMQRHANEQLEVEIKDYPEDV